MHCKRGSVPPGAFLIPRRFLSIILAMFYTTRRRIFSVSPPQVRHKMRRNHARSTLVRRVQLLWAARLTCSPTAPLLQSWASRGMRPWMCVKETCRHVNPSRAPACELCNDAKPVIAGWVCESCSTKNYRGIKQCKACSAPHNPNAWTCAVCSKNNAVDELEDNSICGHCGYDMAPLSKSEEELLRMRQEHESRERAAQESFDEIRSQEADDQMGSEVAGYDPTAPPSWATPKSIDPSTSTLARDEMPSAASRLQKEVEKIVAKPIAPFQMSASTSQAFSAIGRRAQNLEEARVARSLESTVPQGPPGFDWMCRQKTCGTFNGGDDEACEACGVKLVPSEWDCPLCSAANHLSRSACFNCNARIPASWRCRECQASTSIYDKTCRVCEVSRPEPAPQVQGRDFGGGGGTRVPRAKKSDWSCPSCNILNFASRMRCFKCDAERPQPRMRSGGVERGPGSPGGEGTAGNATEELRLVGEGNWSCQECGANNFRTRATCWQCNAKGDAARVHSWEQNDEAPRFEKEGFQDEAENNALPPGKTKSWGTGGVLKGGSPDEWTCSKCFAKNFRGKTECFKCGVQKSVLITPRRLQVKKPAKI